MPTFSNRSALRNCSTSWNLWNWFHKSYKFGVIATLVEFEPGGFQFQENLANIFLKRLVIFIDHSRSRRANSSAVAPHWSGPENSQCPSRVPGTQSPRGTFRTLDCGPAFSASRLPDQRLHRSDAEIRSHLLNPSAILSGKRSPVACFSFRSAELVMSISPSRARSHRAPPS